MIEFYVSLIRVHSCPEVLASCTHIHGDYWFFEGDLDALECPFEVIGTDGIVPSLGGLTESQLVRMADEVFGFQIPRTHRKRPGKKD